MNSGTVLRLQLQHPFEKSRETVRKHTGAEFMLRCAELNLSDEALKEMSMGMVYDMMIEKGNDYHEYPYKATRADISRLLG